MKKIFVRSPYIISINKSNQIGSRVELFIWNSNIAEPTTPTYTFTKNIVSATQTENVYNIANECVEFINEKKPLYTTTTQLESYLNWCYAKVKIYYQDNTGTFNLIDEETFVCFDGYTSALNGANQYDDSDIVPLFNPEIKVYTKQSQINYVNAWLKTPAHAQIYKWNGLFITISSDGLYKLPYSGTGFYTLEYGNSISGFDSYFTLNVETLCESKYTPLICSFINRYGGWSFLTFFKAHQESIQVKSSTFNLMPENWNYDTFIGSNKNFNFNGTQSITCNTGWVDENYFELIQDLLVSPTILLDNIPVICKTQSSDFKTRLKDKNINYTINFDYNFNLINDVI